MFAIGEVRADVSSPNSPCSILPGEFYRAGSIRVTDVFKVTQKNRCRVSYFRVFLSPMNRSELNRVMPETLLSTIVGRRDCRPTDWTGRITLFHFGVGCSYDVPLAPWSRGIDWLAAGGAERGAGSCQR